MVLVSRMQQLLDKRMTSLFLMLYNSRQSASCTMSTKALCIKLVETRLKILLVTWLVGTQACTTVIWQSCITVWAFHRPVFSLPLFSHLSKVLCSKDLRSFDWMCKHSSSINFRQLSKFATCTWIISNVTCKSLFFINFFACCFFFL